MIQDRTLMDRLPGRVRLIAFAALIALSLIIWFSFFRFVTGWL